MKRFAIAALLLSALATLTSPCLGFCIPPFGWHSKSLVERMELGEAEVVVLATVDATSPAHPYKYPYTADLIVDCVYKDTSGESERLPDYLKDVEGFGGSWDCAETRVEAGTQYIIFLNRRGPYAAEVAEVNSQSGAEQAIPTRLKKVEEKYQCI
ncbi:uncharacterized protein LOC119740518 [Patiria miniata]|uniref:Uncharacterized protein n=1 Tax=Patiria miniata TaxID=46514 RepID=A0A914B6N8_PATMI|nr:uncharacterized protein LOC119740518 [Patiria miniata]